MTEVELPDVEEVLDELNEAVACTPCGHSLPEAVDKTIALITHLSQALEEANTRADAEYKERVHFVQQAAAERDALREQLDRYQAEYGPEISTAYLQEQQ